MERVDPLSGGADRGHPVTVERADLARLLHAWRCSTGLKEGTGMDPAAIAESAKALTFAMLDTVVEEVESVHGK